MNSPGWTSVPQKRTRPQFEAADAFVEKRAAGGYSTFAIFFAVRTPFASRVPLTIT